ncbi:hypothetical protein NL676_027676 [Syzygium grande]|nr:hypothetical protein NL676_027676 [Syzygium grande]
MDGKVTSVRFSTCRVRLVRIGEETSGQRTSLVAVRHGYWNIEDTGPEVCWRLLDETSVLMGTTVSSSSCRY